MPRFQGKSVWTNGPIMSSSKASSKTGIGPCVALPSVKTEPVLSLRGPAAILFISRDTCSDSIAKVFRACFHVVSHNYRAIRCKMGYRTDVPV